MGAWGYDPWDNDGFGDLTDGLRAAFVQTLEANSPEDATSETDTYAWCGLVVKAIAFDGATLLDHEWLANEALLWLSWLAGNEKWITDWDNPSQIRQNLRLCIRSIEQWQERYE